MDYIVKELDNGSYSVMPETNYNNVIKADNVSNISHQQANQKVIQQPIDRKQLEDVLKKKEEKIEQLMKEYKIAKYKDTKQSILFEMEQYSLQKSKILETLCTNDSTKIKTRDDKEYTEQEKKEIMELIESVPDGGIS